MIEPLENELKYVNFPYLESISSLVFPLIQLQAIYNTQMGKDEIEKLKNDHCYNFFKTQYKE